MTTKMLGVAFTTYATRGASYTANSVGVINAAAGDVLDLLNSGCTVAADAQSSATMTQFGSALAGSNFVTFASDGTLYHKVAAPIAGNAANTDDNVLGGFVLPVGAFDVAMRGLMLKFGGKHGATGNNKRIQVWANPTLAGHTVTAGVISGGTVTGVGDGAVLLDTGTITGNNTGWELELDWVKYGAAASDTQLIQNRKIFGVAHGGTSLPTATTIPEDAVINIVITGSSATSGAANDIVLNSILARAMN